MVIALRGGMATEIGGSGNYAAYVAGIEIILGDKSLSPADAARRYRTLCKITGVAAKDAKRFILQFRNDPAGWQKFETLVMDNIQKKG